MDLLKCEKSSLLKALFVLALILCLYFAIQTISEIKNYNDVPADVTVNTMSFDGEGDVSAVPNLATISFTLVGDAANMQDAQTKVTAKETAVLNFLNTDGIAKGDIQTQDYSSYPQYQNQNAVCPPTPIPMSGGIVSNIAVYCPPSKQILTGYETSENISVKVRDLTKVGAVVAGIGTIGVSNISGPNYSIENQDALQEQARKIAITNAEAKAQTLAKDLGINLVRIVNFSEDNGSPIMYPKAMAMTVSSTANASAPALPTGENKITSNVTITYEIR
ncbi:MAG: SIMPL domain-containing protein [Candidatus Pacebacteria bacterium]|nr:SIMPL domain-containing protein [Candidatus Paceibacterota bacterium]